MISYEPLFDLLKARGQVISEFRGVFLSSRTIVRIKSNQSVQLRTIETICKVMDVSIEQVVKITN